MVTMPGGRKPKIDGAFQDVVLKPIPGSDEFGGYTQQEEQIAAVGKPPSDMLLPQDAAAMQYTPEDIFAKGTERQDEPGTFDSNPQQTVSLPVGTDTQILIELIKEKAPVTNQRF
jgi:hypothetical protein